MTATKRYTSAATIEILARDPVVMKVQEVRASDLHGPEDLNTEVKILESSALVQMVAERLTTGREQGAHGLPYEKDSSGEPVMPEGIILKNRKILPARMTRVIQVVFTHPDPEMAARIANLFVEEFSNYNVRWRVEESMKAVEDLKIRADQQAKKVQELGNNLQAYRERQNMISLDEKKDIVTEKLKALSTLVTQANSRLMDAQVLLEPGPGHASRTAETWPIWGSLRPRSRWSGACCMRSGRRRSRSRTSSSGSGRSTRR
jgi:succinoglycan biosynthesis transport protein ExoP